MTPPRIDEILAAFRAANHEDLHGLNKSFRELVGYLDTHFEDQALVATLAAWPDELKTLIIQQFFQHDQPGSHQTRFDIRKVNRLLSEWFGIRIDEDPAAHPALGQGSRFPGRVSEPGISQLAFGDTQFYFHIGAEHYRAAQDLVATLCENTILTVEKASPPCAMAEIVPLWLRDRTLDPDSYYIRPGQKHVIAGYFASVQSSLKQHFGFEILYPSSELAIITNGDALRFHRDRLVNQYQFLDSGEGLRAEYSIAQCLTLMSWDMQEDTLSGTIFDHPDGNRFIFCLYPGEIVNLVFTEDAKPIGPMMMPYHCALPVVDLRSDKSVGAAKGKRFSTVLRGLVKKRALAALASRTSHLTLGPETDHAKGTTLLPNVFPAPGNLSGQLIRPVGEAVCVLEIGYAGNESLFGEIGAIAPGPARVFRVSKESPGFTSLGAIVPGYALAERVICINRSKNGPTGLLSYPLALDYTAEQKPWIQLIPIGDAHALEIAEASRHLAKLSPADELFHRSAVTDSFHQFTAAKPRMAIIVDIVVTGPNVYADQSSKP